MDQPADIEFVDVSKRFGDVIAVDDVSLSVERGAFFFFLEPSGCGKTTSLRMIAGFDQPTKGDVRLSGQSVVNALCPAGSISPSMNPTSNRLDGRAAIEKYVAETIPMGRSAATDDFAGAILFLASDHSSFMTGHELDVDGGQWFG